MGLQWMTMPMLMELTAPKLQAMEQAAHPLLATPALPLGQAKRRAVDKHRLLQASRQMSLLVVLQRRWELGRSEFSECSLRLRQSDLPSRLQLLLLLALLPLLALLAGRRAGSQLMP